MGTGYPARCKQCGNRFVVHEGASMGAELTHCNTCGAEKFVSHEDMGDLWTRHIKFLVLTLPRTETSNSRVIDIEQRILSSPVEPVNLHDYARELSRIAGTCACGGTFERDAPARCPQCRSSDFEDTGEFIETYD